MQFKVGDRVKIKDEFKKYDNDSDIRLHEHLEDNGYNYNSTFTITKIINRTMFSGEFPLALKFVELVNENKEYYNIANEELENTNRYKTNSGKQLFDVLEDDLLSYEEMRGAYKFSIYRYTHRYKQKGKLKDLKKIKVYADQLIKLEEKQNEI